MVLVQLLLPVVDGPAGDAATLLAQTRRELVEQFNGVTAYVRSPARGLWTSPDGRTEADDVVMVEVVTDRFDRQWWRRYTDSLAQRFEQQEIHVRAVPVQTTDDDTR